MPNWTKLAAGWALAAVAAVALSWGAVAQVRNSVIQPSTPIPGTLAAGSTTTVGASPEPTIIHLEVNSGSAGTTASVVPADQTPAGDPAAGQADPTQLPPGATTSSSPSNQAATTTTTASPTSAASTSTTTTIPATTTTTTAPTVPVATQTSSYQLIGGVVTISYSPGTVTFVSAIPQAGYGTEIKDSGPERVRVEFRADNHTSVFRAEWNGDRLEISKDENGES